MYEPQRNRECSGRMDMAGRDRAWNDRSAHDGATQARPRYNLAPERVRLR